MQHKSNKQLLESSLERVARILADRYDIKVIFSGNQCQTEGRLIVLPSLPEDCPDDLYHAIQGYVDHEAAHIIFDDFEILNSVKDPLISVWLNVLCDLRIEQQMGDLWKGCRRNLKAALEYIISTKIFPEWEDIPDLNKLIQSSIIYGSGIPSFFEQITDGADWLAKIEVIKPALDIAKAQPDTLHSLALAMWIVKVLGQEKEAIPLSKELQEKVDKIQESVSQQVALHSPSSVEDIQSTEIEEKEEKASDSGTESTSESSDGPKESERSIGTQEDELRLGQVPDNEDELQGEQPEDSLFDDDEKSALDTIQKIVQSHSTEIRDALQDYRESMSSAIRTGIENYTHQDTTGYEFYAPYTTRYDKIQIAPNGDKQIFIKDRNNIKKMCGVLMRKLRSSLLSREKRIMQYDKTWGKLNSRSLPNFLLTGSNRVFKQTSVGEVLNCRISLLIDQSGSMGNSKKDKEARKAAILFGEMCNQLNIPFEILSFTTIDFDTDLERISKATEEEQQRFTRWGDLSITIYKQFFEKWVQVGHRLSHFSGKYHNYDGEAIKCAAKRLLAAQRPNERLILFVFSDGLPEQALRDYQPHHQWYLKSVLKDCEHIGVECIGVGICSQHVSSYYPNWVIIEDATALSELQLLKLKEVLEGTHRNQKRRYRI